MRVAKVSPRERGHQDKLVKAGATDEKTIATALVQQYDEAQGKLKEGVAAAVKFGAMLIKAEEIVFADGNPKRHNGHESGFGLQAWIEANCPTINYKTAMRWKSIAEGLLPQLGCDRENALLVLVGQTKDCSPELPVSEIEDSVEKIYQEAGSLRKLSQMCFAFADDDKGGRPKAEQKPLPKLSRMAEAKAIWSGVLNVVGKTSVRDAIPLLEAKVAEVCYETMAGLTKALKKQAEG